MTDEDEKKAEKYAKASYWDVKSMGKARIAEDREHGAEDFLAGAKYGREQERARILYVAEKEFVRWDYGVLIIEELEKIIEGAE